MAKEIIAKIKLHVTGGQATPAPPVGPALSQHQINIGQFVSQFNERTKGSQGVTIPVEVFVYQDSSFDFVTKSPPAAELLKQAAGIVQGSPTPNREKVGQVTKAQAEEIAQTKLNDLNTRDLDQALKVIEGTARSMGIDIVE